MFLFMSLENTEAITKNIQHWKMPTKRRLLLQCFNVKVFEENAEETIEVDLKLIKLDTDKIINYYFLIKT